MPDVLMSHGGSKLVSGIKNFFLYSKWTYNRNVQLIENRQSKYKLFKTAIIIIVLN